MVKDISEHNDQIKSNEHTLKLLHEHFPQCFTKEGNFDLKVFASLVKDALPVTYEGYGLDFLGKNYASLLASTDTTTVIVPDEEHNSKPENQNSENIYISGDNLDGLKHLLKSYSGRVKCIYIDPPYNTGTDGFVYNDSFKFTEESLQSKLDVNPDQAKRILDLARRGSASHSAWLMFMLPRLLLAKDLLSKDGVIFISIDDNEQANLKLLCDYVFGEENMIAQFCKKGTGGRQDSSHFAKIHEYVLVYANPEYEAGEMAKGEDKYPFTDSEGRKYKTVLLRKWGDAALRMDRPNMFYPIFYNGKEISLKDELGPQSRSIIPMLDDKTEGRWRWGSDTMKDAIEKHLVEIKEIKGEPIAYERVYEPTEDEVPTKLFNTWIDDINNNTGKALLKNLFDGNVPFDYPKPLDLIKRIIKMGNAMDGIVVDFFSGSATTAHAIMEMNADDKDHRKFFLIQWPEETKEGSVARNLGFETIDQIGMERIKRAAAKIKAEHPDYDGDLGFKHYTLQEPSDNTWTKLERFDPNVMFGENILDEFGRNTVLQTWYVRDGYGFNPKVEEVVLDTYTAYHCGSHLYFLDPGLTEDDMVSLVRRYHSDPSFNPDNLVIFGYSFNFTETELLKKNLAPLRDDINNLKINMDIRY